VYEEIMGIPKRAASTRAVKNSALVRIYYPTATVKCEGAAVYRSQVARDVGCLLDVNTSVASWRCMALCLGDGETAHVPDFLVSDVDGSAMLIDAPDRTPSLDVDELKTEARKKDARYWLLSRKEVYDGFRLRNAKDLLRYGHHETPLGDRLRLLAALDDEGSLPLADCLNAFQETKPVPGIAALILNGFVHVDLDDGPLGPDTLVRRIGR
jgi:hypothetical protein